MSVILKASGDSRVLRVRCVVARRSCSRRAHRWTGRRSPGSWSGARSWSPVVNWSRAGARAGSRTWGAWSTGVAAARSRAVGWTRAGRTTGARSWDRDRWDRERWDRERWDWDCRVRRTAGAAERSWPAGTSRARRTWRARRARTSATSRPADPASTRTARTTRMPPRPAEWTSTSPPRWSHRRSLRPRATSRTRRTAACSRPADPTP